MCTECKYKYLKIKKVILFSSASSQNTFNTPVRYYVLEQASTVKSEVQSEWVNFIRLL